MTVNLSISRIIDIGVEITPQLVQGQATNTGLILGTSTVIDTVTRLRNYSTLNEVEADFTSQTEEFLAAEIWFEQQPQPTTLSIGRWCKTAAAGKLLCAPLSLVNQSIAPWNAIATGAFTIQADGGAATNVPTLNFAAAASLGAVATIIQTGVRALAGVYANVSVVYNPSFTRFEFTSGTTGPSSQIAFLTAGSTGVDISGMLGGLVTSSGAFEAPGVAAETAIAAVTLFDNQFGGQWYNLIVPDAVDSDTLAIAPFIDGGSNLHFLWVTSNESAMLVSGDTTHIGFLLQQLQAQHTAVQYSTTSPYAAWSMAARISTVNWAGSLTAISLMYKQEPGVSPEALNDTQVTALESYNVNVFVTYDIGGGNPIIEFGICPSGQFIDTIIGVDALRSQTQTNIFNLQLGTQTKIPQTDAGVTDLETGVESACSQFIVNGLGAPGTWNAAGFGTLNQGDYLDKGYYIFSEPLALQNESARADREAPPIQVAFKLSGAIDTVAATIFVNS